YAFRVMISESMRFRAALVILSATLAGAQTLPQVRSLTVDGRLIVYEVRDGLAITQGDIILGPADELEAAARCEEQAVSRLRRTSIVTPSSSRLWRGATLYYSIDSDMPNPSRLEAAVDHWNNNTQIKMLKRTSEPNYVRFKRTTGDFACSSN